MHTARIASHTTTLLAVLLCSLAQPSFAAFRRLYSGPTLPRSEVAFVFEYGEGTEIYRINDVVLHETFFSWGGINGVELLPGQYVLRIGFFTQDTSTRETTTTTAESVPMNVTLMPGHIYVVMDQGKFGLFRPTLRDAGEGLETWELKPWEEKNLRKRLEDVDKYFKGDRREFKHVDKFVEAKSRLDREIAEVSQAWEKAVVGNVVEIKLADKTIVAVVDKLKEDTLIYYLPDDPDNTYPAQRVLIRDLKILAATVEEYRKRQ